MLIFGLLTVTFSIISNATWLCEEAASIKQGEALVVCGIGEDADEDKALKLALNNAFAELDAVCSRSADCRGFELNIEPLRNECKPLGKTYKCYRGVRAEITTTKKPVEKSVMIDKLIETESKHEKLVTNYYCGFDTEAALAAFDDLSTPARVKKAAKAAAGIPIRKACIRFHFSVMNVLERAKINSPDYNSFLITSVLSSANAEEVGTAIEIIRYLHGQGEYDAVKWNAVRSTLVRTPQRRLHEITPYLFHSGKDQNRKLQLTRLDEVAALGLSGKIGRPTTLSPDRALTEIFRSLLADRHLMEPWLSTEFLSKYFEKYTFTETEDMHHHLYQYYKAAPSATAKRHALDRLILNISRSLKPSYRPIEQVADDLERELARAGDDEKRVQQLQSDLRYFLSKNATTLDRAAESVKEAHTRKRLAEFCLHHNLSCPSLLPSDEQIAANISSISKEKRHLSLKVLIARPDLARKHLNEVFALIRTTDSTAKNRDSIELAIRALLSAPTTEREHIQRIFAIALNRQFSYDEALEKLGKHATPVISQMADDSNHPNQNTAIAILKSLASQDPEALKKLRFLATEHKDEHTRRTAKGALDSI